MQIQVYLNEAYEHYRGFAEQYVPALKLVSQFEVSDDVKVYVRDGIPVGMLEWVFEQLNMAGDLIEAELWAVAYLLGRHRSLSVGDVVAVGEMAYAVEASGWTRIDTDALVRAIDRGTAASV